jgi:hypothetical protein
MEKLGIDMNFNNNFPQSQNILDNFQTKNHLINLLLQCPSIKDEMSRHALVKELHFAHAIENHPRSDIHLLNIVTACMNYHDGFERLFEVLRNFDGETRQFKTLIDEFNHVTNLKQQLSERQPISSFMATKKALLNERLANLQKRYEAVFTQREATLDEGNKIPLSIQLEQLEKQIKQMENELSQL